MIQKAIKIIALCIVCITPAYSDCGTWQQSYTMLYNRILTGDMQPRYAVFVAVEAGLADNLLGLITSMLLSALSANSSIHPAKHQRCSCKPPTFPYELCIYVLDACFLR